ncbi:Coenzyme PQQ synthesis protein D (PqqD) [Paenibacillus sp. UNCCL117]|uniref:PqqD family protein n=1 Tax=unclassified Paenibacillus TaxID=185978 RepID=UPI00088B34DD|nr:MULTISPECIES: PqqD family protein [unclassified Paenibacillus]SDC02314.1 Coenzyme PQQ synthesis protein D (PqqD) [Paenibacillus sp. cl123]SFW36820.1 Coenzyme PQQ synthesis protein D (PqqD) [Paenibacillus sp. UNCCL117]
MTNPIVSTAYRRAANAEAFEVEGQWVIMHADQYTITKLNEVGGLIWSKLGEEQTSEALVGAILDQYEITEPEAERDVDAFLTQLLQLGLIEYAG